MPWYVPVAPPEDLARILACTWTATPSGSHRLVPDACLDLVWISSGQLWLCGPETTAWDFALPAGTTAVGVRFRPGVASHLFRLDASTIRDRRVDISAVIGDEDERCLRARLDAGADLDDRVSALERFVTDRAGMVAVLPDPTAERVLNELASAPRATAAELAVQLGMTTRQLHRRSMFDFGYGTSTLARLLRFQRFLAAAGSGDGSTRSLARLAVDAGFSDQAHLARDCRAITRQTPTAFLDGYFPTFPDMSDPYKTAEPFSVTMGA